MNKTKKKTSNPIIAAHDQTNYSIHTFTFRAGLTRVSRDSIEEKLIRLSKKKNRGYYIKGKKPYRTTNYNVASDFGFNTVSLLTITSENMTTSYWMDVKVNPRRMFHKDDHPFVYIADRDDLLYSYIQLDCFLRQAGITEINNAVFYIQRADYCVNIDLEDQERVKAYMRLMKKGAYPYKSERMTEYSEKGKREIPTQDSFTVNTKRFEFSVYDKHIQLSREADKYAKEEIREAEGMIRIELRVKRPKIHYDEKKTECNSTLEFLLSADEIAEGNIPRYLKQAYGSGKFVKLDRAREIIDVSRCKKKTRDQMVEILKKVSRGNLQEVKDSYGKDFSKYMKKFNELGISPITLEKRSPFSELENPLYYIEHRNKNFC